MLRSILLIAIVSIAFGSVPSSAYAREIVSIGGDIQLEEMQIENRQCDEEDWEACAQRQRTDKGNIGVYVLYIKNLSTRTVNFLLGLDGQRSGLQQGREFSIRPGVGRLYVIEEDNGALTDNAPVYIQYQGTISRLRPRSVLRVDSQGRLRVESSNP